MLIKCPEDSIFLLAKREKGHHGVMFSVDKVLAAVEMLVKDGCCGS